MLRQRLVEQANDKDSKERRVQQELAITHKIAQIQAEASASIHQLQHRLESMQTELAQRAKRDEQLHKKASEAQIAATQQAESSSAKDAVITQLKERLVEAQQKGKPAIRVQQQDASNQYNGPEATLQVVTPQMAHSPSVSIPPSTPPIAVVAPAPVIAPTPAVASAPIIASIVTPLVGASSRNDRKDEETQCSKLVRASSPQSVSGPLASSIAKQIQNLQKDSEEKCRRYEATIKRLESQVTSATTTTASEKTELEMRCSTLQKHINELKTKCEERELKHKEEVLRFLEERNKAKVRPRTAEKGIDATATVAPNVTNVTPPAATSTAQPQSAQPPAAIAPNLGAEVVRTPRGALLMQKAAQRNNDWSEVQTATAAVRLHDTIRKQRIELAQLTKELEKVPRLQDEVSALKKEVEERKNEILELRAKVASQQTNPAETRVFMQLKDLKAHKRELLRVEDELETVKRVVKVEKEGEIRSLISRLEKRDADVRQLEGELSVMRAHFGGSLPSQPTVNVGEAKLQEEAMRALEAKVLCQEGALLDLRFERESLFMRVQRLEQHIADLLATSEAERISKPQPKEMVAQRGAMIANLEAVVEQMKGVIEKLQHDNAQLRQSGVTSAKYMEAQRQLKSLQTREKGLMDTIQALSFKLSQAQAALRPVGKITEQNVSLQRKLHAAQNMAEQYQTELNDLKQLLVCKGINPPPSMDNAATATPTKERLVMGSLSIHAPDNHHFLPHHMDCSPSAIPRENVGRPQDAPA